MIKTKKVVLIRNHQDLHQEDYHLIQDINQQHQIRDHHHYHNQEQVDQKKNHILKDQYLSLLHMKKDYVMIMTIQ
jgi:hypothetical protein